MTQTTELIYPIILNDSDFIATIKLPTSFSKKDAEKICAVVMALSDENAKSPTDLKKQDKSKL